MSSSNLPPGLAGSDLFRDLSPAELTRLERLAHRRSYDPGAVIVSEGQGGIAYFVVTAGQVAVTRGERELRRIGPGGGFGEMALFSDRPRSATVTAVEPTQCLALHRLEFLEELRRSPDTALRLLDSLAQRLDNANAL